MNIDASGKETVPSNKGGVVEQWPGKGKHMTSVQAHFKTEWAS